MHELCKYIGTKSIVSKKDIELVNKIISINVDATLVKSDTGLTALHLLVSNLNFDILNATSDSNLANIIESLAEKDNDAVYERDSTGNLPIHYVCKNLLFSSAQILLGFNCPLNRINDFLGESTSMKQLLEINNDNCSPLKLVLSQKHNTLYQNQQRNNLIALLVNIEPDSVMIEDRKGDTLIHTLAKKADAKSLAVILEAFDFKSKRNR